MYCIYCGTEIKSEYKNCPKCGKALQMVPDYSIYDEDDINLILESTNDVELGTKDSNQDVPEKIIVKKSGCCCAFCGTNEELKDVKGIRVCQSCVDEIKEGVFFDAIVLLE